MHDGYKAQDSYRDVLRNFVQPESKYAPYVFWFYDEDLTALGIKPQEMAHELAKKGFNPGYAHARINHAYEFTKRDSVHIRPLPKEQWLSDQWFDVLKKQAHQAAADGVHASYADDYGWPSMQAGGILVEADPTLKSKNLRYRYIDLEKGDTIDLDGCFFAVSGKRMRTEQTSFVEYIPAESWRWSKASFDQTPPQYNNTLPLNMASAWSDDPDAYCVYHLNIPADGKYKLYACWSHTGNNTSDAVYDIGGQTVHMNQHGEIYRWNLLGEFRLTGGMNTVRLKNGSTGRLSADGLKAAAEDGKEIIIDDYQTTDRRIAYLDSGSLTVLEGSSYTAGESCRGYLFDLQEHRGYDGSTIDYLQKRVSGLFIETAWKPSAERLGSFMGSGQPINGIFSDHEGDYGYKLAWSDDLRELFSEKYAEDIRRILPLLIDRDVQGQDVVWRYRWFDTVSDLYAEHFHRLSAEAARHDVYFTMHTWEESLQLQAACVGDIFKLNRGISLPGTDALCCVAYNPQNFKDLFSAAEFEGVRFMDEVMALNGLDRYTPDELKKQANYLALYGVSHVINHAVKMTRELAQSVVTPDFYNIDPCWQAMRQYTDFVRRTSYINSLGHVNAEVLLLNPLDSMYALAENDVFDMDYEMLDVGGGIPKICASFGGEAGEINRQYGEIIRILTRQRAEHLTADKEYLRRMEVRGNRLCYKNYVFNTVIIPRTEILDLETAVKLTEFAQNGGEIYWIGPMPTSTLQNGRNDPALSDCIAALRHLSGVHFLNTPDELNLKASVQLGNSGVDLLSHWRIVDGRHFIFLCHNSDSSVKSVVHLPGIFGKSMRLNPSTGTMEPADTTEDENGLIVRLQFAPYEAFYLVIDPSEKHDMLPDTQKIIREIPLTAFTAEIDRGNTDKSVIHPIEPISTSKLRLILRKGCFDDPTHPDVTEIELYRGGMTVLCRSIRQTFTVEFDEVGEVVLEFPMQEIDGIRVISEKGLTSYRIETWNGNWWQTAAELDTYSQSEVIHPIEYPAGIYDVSLTDWSGWDFLPDNFAGVLTYRTTVTLNWNDLCGNAVLEIEKFCGSVQVIVNNIPLGSKMFAPFHFNLGSTLTAGDNHIELRVSNTIVSNISHKRGGIQNVSLKIFHKGESK